MYVCTVLFGYKPDTQIIRLLTAPGKQSGRPPLKYWHQWIEPLGRGHI